MILLASNRVFYNNYYTINRLIYKIFCIIFISFFLFTLFIGFIDSTLISSTQDQSHSKHLLKSSSLGFSKFLITGLRGGIYREDSEGGSDANFDNLKNRYKSALEITGATSLLNGAYYKTESDINGRSHFERVLDNSKKIHLYWTGTQWVLHYDLDPSKNLENLLAYSKLKVEDPRMAASSWFVKVGKTFELSPLFGIAKVAGEKGHEEEEQQNVDATSALSTADFGNDEYLGIPRKLIPFYISFMLDAIAVGLVMPLLPFTIMELGANALQLSLVVSSNYVAQSIGCVIMGRVSDAYGRKLVMCLCLIASSLSYFFLSRADSLLGFALARIISGSFGGLVPIMQSAVGDVASATDRPKYLGRIMATFGLGFVLGPGLSAVLSTWTTRQKIRLASLLPFLGLTCIFLFGLETKKNARVLLSLPGLAPKKKTAKISPAKIINKESIPPVSLEVMVLVVNGFSIMYAFATETIYAMFIKDSFGYGEHTLSLLFALNGMFIGIFQVFLIKPVISLIGKHATLAIGNILLALGMVGVALVRQQTPHFALFAAHIVGYSIADTALASLITRYSSQSTLGRDLAFNQAAQACSRVLSPLVAGYLYEQSKKSQVLPVGALPFIAGACLPAFAVAIPAFLYIRKMSGKLKRVDSYDLGPGNDHLEENSLLAPMSPVKGANQ